MKHVELKKSIANQKRAIAQTEKNILSMLRGNDLAVRSFKNITNEFKRERKQSIGLGASDDSTPWYENKFVTKLFDLGTSQLTARNNQKELQIQLDTVAKQNAALDKQLSLQARLNQAGGNAAAYGGSFIDELIGSPTKLALLAGAGFYLFKMKGKR